MHKIAKLVAISIALATMSHYANSQGSSPPTAELAKKCRQLALKAHPLARPGTKSGSAQAEREYFTECIRKGGHMDEGSAGKK
jgi:hypothetical protein